MFPLLIVVAMILQTGGQLRAQDIPATTKSDEALKHYQKGIENVDFFLIPQAKEEFRAAVKADPDFGAAYYNLFTLSVTADEAKDYLDKAMNLIDKLTEPERLLILSAKAGSDNNTEAALSNLKQMAALLPDGRRAHYILGNYLYGLQKWDEAEKEYKRCIEIDSHYAPPFNNLAYLYSNQGKYEDAIKALQKYAEARPADANPQDSMGEIYLWMGDHLNSIKHYGNALKLDPSYAPSYAGIGHNYTFMGKYEQAREEYTLMTTKARNLADSSNTFFWVTVSYLHEGKPEQAAVTLLKQLDFCKAHNMIQLEAGIHGQLGRVYAQSENYDKALEQVGIERQLAMDPQFQPGARAAAIMDGLFTESMICSKIGKSEQSVAKAAEYLKWAGETGNPLIQQNVHTLNGINAFWAKDYKFAQQELEQGNPLNQESKYYLGLCYEAQGKKTEANRIFSEIAKFNQNSIIYGLYRRLAMEKTQA
jgi:tetratricopeptide (TPR) repeat protein